MGARPSEIFSSTPSRSRQYRVATHLPCGVAPAWNPKTIVGLVRWCCVVDRFGASGAVYRETEVERTDLETIIADLMSGQFNDPIRVVAFNTLEHWSADVTEYIAFEFKPAAISKAMPSPSKPEISSRATPVLIIIAVRSRLALC